MGIYSNTAPGLCDLGHGSIVSLPFFSRRQSVVSRTDPAVIPVAHKISPNHELQLPDSVVLLFNPRL